MALVFADRVYETSTTTGLGTFDLDGAAGGGYNTFAAAIGDGNTCYYAIVNSSTNQWEVGLGTVTDAVTDTLSRDTVYDSSDNGNKINFSAGTKQVFQVDPAVFLQYLNDTYPNWNTAYGWGDHAVEGYLKNIVEDTTPQLGGQLDANGNSINMGTNEITDTAVGQWITAYSWGDHSTAGYLQNIVEDTTPQLGGTLDTNGYHIALDNGYGFTAGTGSYFRNSSGSLWLVKGDNALGSVFRILDSADTQIADFSGPSGIELNNYTLISPNASGVGSYFGGADDLIVENNTSAGITIATPDTDAGYLVFADTLNTAACSLSFNHNTDIFYCTIDATIVYSLTETGFYIDDAVPVYGAGGAVFGNSLSDALGNVTGYVTVSCGDSGVSTIQTDADELILENNLDVGLTLACPIDREGWIRFDDPGGSAGSISYNHTNDYLNFMVNGSSQFRIDSTGRALFGAVGTDLLGASSGATTISVGNSGVSSANSAADALMIEDSTGTGITIATPNTVSGNIYFADPEGTQPGGISYNHSTDTMTLRADAADTMAITNNGVIIGDLTTDITGYGSGHLIISKGDSGSTSVAGDANQFILESATNSGMSITCPSTGYGSIRFGDESSTNSGAIIYDHPTDTLNLRAGGNTFIEISNGEFKLTNGANDVLSLFNTNSTTTGPDIQIYSGGVIACEASLTVCIDSDNSATGNTFTIAHDANNTSSATDLFSVSENGDAEVHQGSMIAPNVGFFIVGEENATITGTGYLFSYGNGATNQYGPVVPFACTVTHLTIGTIDNSTATFTVQLVQNGTPVSGATVTLSAAASGTQALGTPVSFAAGDRLSFYVSAFTSASSGAIASAFIKSS